MHGSTTDELIITKLRAARYEFVCETFRIKAIALGALLRKAGFRPDQPRVPRGYPDGGQWTDEGIDRSSIEDDFPLILISDERNRPMKTAGVIVCGAGAGR